VVLTAEGSSRRQGSGAVLARGRVEVGGCFSFGPQQREIRAHVVVATCTARGGGVAGGRPCRREVAGGDYTTAAFPRARGPGHASVGQRGPLASEPCH
jgi:hypothetical protein